MVAGKLKIYVKSYQPSRSYCLVSETWGFEVIEGLGVEIKHSERYVKNKTF